MATSRRFTLLALLAAAVYLLFHIRGWTGSGVQRWTVPAAFLLFWLLGRPWSWREKPVPLRQWVRIGAVGSALAGVFFGLNVLLAASWSLLLLLFIDVFAEGAARRLVLLPFLGFPWAATDLHLVSRLLRASQAAALDWVFFALGIEVRRFGTTLEIEGVPLWVDESISGIDLFQAMMVVGFVLAFLWAPAGKRFWWAVAAIIPLAWLVSVVRLLVMGTLVLSVNPSFAFAWLQQWGTCLALCLMAILSRGLFAWIATCTFNTQEPVRWE